MFRLVVEWGRQTAWSVSVKRARNANANGTTAMAVSAVAHVAHWMPTRSPRRPYTTGEIALEPMVPV
jgi:hypothetical protein